ncbi:hypothetical protein N7478_005110 [Penicillium angulare]|uniref:uncharacterized protein n=1 Tax=Penicillium angulare TaxID=116970 RepID=UPI0025401956|nr:uncharacterized protein N7478_005110 [Penicillium angulare]KAJ5279738.1 hypothetical protein N7478_005110 [Penicillium angulare]
MVHDEAIVADDDDDGVSDLGSDGLQSLPSDEEQFETYEAGHIVALLMNSDHHNSLFRAPVGEDARHILDIGTGTGNWAIDVADRFPQTIVRGVDIFPPPVTWAPPNCILEVDDVLQEWTWSQPFDLIHLRIMEASFTPEELDRLYKQSYQNLHPGGWIEQLEVTMDLFSDDDSLPLDSAAINWGEINHKAAEKCGRPFQLFSTLEKRIQEAGFVDIHIQHQKWPVGPWARDHLLKEAGLVNLQHWLLGVEGYSMFHLTKYGDPVPWTRAEVIVYAAKLRSELKNPHYHTYHKAKRVWARKPSDDSQS